MSSLCVCLNIINMQCCRGLEEGITSHGTGVIEGCGHPCRCWGPHLSALEEHSVLLNREPCGHYLLLFLSRVVSFYLLSQDGSRRHFKMWNPWWGAIAHPYNLPTLKIKAAESWVWDQPWCIRKKNLFQKRNSRHHCWPDDSESFCLKNEKVVC